MAEVPWLVMKFGGTSIGNLLDTITHNIIPKYLKLYNVAVVCSARSGTSKSKGTSSLLLEAIYLSTSDETSTVELDQIIDTIKDDHIGAARSALSRGIEPVHDDSLLEELEKHIRTDCEQLRSLLKAAWTVGELSTRVQDRVLAVGEKLACRIVVASLQKNARNRF